VTQRPQPDRPSGSLLRVVAWACVVAGAGVLAWLAVQYALLTFVLTDAANVDVPFRVFIEGLTAVLVSRIAVASAIVLAVGAAILKFVR
jgi:hypothetical protein